MRAESALLASALLVYGLAAVLAVATAARTGTRYKFVLVLLAVALFIQGIAILIRWQRVGHGPYVNLFEILSSNVWSLHLAVLIACAVFQRIRPSLATVLPTLQILVLWLAATAPTDGAAPVTYNTIWLAIHVWLGKIFLGCVVVAVGLSLVVLARRRMPGWKFEAMPSDIVLDEFVYRIVLVAFIFESLMLVAGAIWAQDAWGRYWAWDPLETWAFVTWLLVAGFLHLRAIRRPAPPLSALMVIAIFAVAFSTFFGTPFVSTAPHKGAV